MNNCYLGIDPGKQGAACFLTETGPIFLDWPKTNCMVDLLSSFRSKRAGLVIIKTGLEKVSAMPGQGVTSMFHFGENVGAWKMLLAANRIPYEDPTPQKWQAGLVRKSDNTNSKQRAYLAASRLYPNFLHLLKGPKGGILDGRVDSLLIAHYLAMKGVK